MAYRPPPTQRSPTSPYSPTHGPYSPPASSPGPRYPPQQGQQYNGHPPPQRQYTSPPPAGYPSQVTGYFEDDRAGLLQHSAPQPSSTAYGGGYNHPLERKGVDQRVNMEQDRMMQQPRKLGYRKVKN